MTDLVTSDGVLFDWPHRPSREKLVTLATSEVIKLLLSERAVERAVGASRLTPAQFRVLFDRPLRWKNLARAAKRIQRWKVETLVSELGERRMLHCAQCRSRDAFLARFAGSLDPKLTEFRRKKRRR